MNIIKNTKKTPKTSTWKISKSFWRRKKEKDEKRPEKDVKFYWRLERKEALVLSGT